MKEEIIKLLKSTNREGIDKVIEFIDSNKRNHNIKTMYTVLG